LVAATLAWLVSAAQAMPGAAPNQHTQRTGPGGAEAMRARPSDPGDVALGRDIYLLGLGENQRPVMGLRFGGVESHGKAVACVGCHRRSGLGAVEGTEQIPPVAGRFIFSDDRLAVVSMNLRTAKRFNQQHAALDDAAFAATMRQGRHIDGHELGMMMPRYELSDAELRGLQAYLRSLSLDWSPGVTATTVQFATVITPDVSPLRREIFLETVRAAVQQKNGNYTPGQRTMSTGAEMMFRTDRRWDLAVWELHGAPDTWTAQLEARQREQPAFALVSGLGGGDWTPVHRFCEQQRMPCWFPSVDAPPAEAPKDFYSIYFSAGVHLEAQVLAQQLLADGPTRVWQLHRGDGAGRAGALALQQALAKSQPRLKLNTLEVGDDDAAVLPQLSQLGAQDVLVLWWPGEEQARLAGWHSKVGKVYASARMARASLAERPAGFTGEWRYVYPYQTSERRLDALFYFSSWLKTRRMTLRDEVMQSEVYFAMSYLAETMSDMIDNVHRDYLVERAENMLSLREGLKAEDETRELLVARFHKGKGGVNGEAKARVEAAQDTRAPRPIPGKTANVFSRREGTTIYPRLGLGQGQRFASKGAYIVKVDADNKVLAVGDWVVP
jgi:hypothetical protein